ncbi:AMP-binding protein [Pseudonocardia sp. CA-142604]|uniref:AMP-binding protein n=1 Tax=Pseudonocardia sp. CA-142604 TaxID=3240024 RepID=UPI003D928516
MIFRSPYPDVDIPDVALPEFLFGHLDPADADRPAVLAADTGRGYTFGELTRTVSGVASALGERGLGRGDVAAIFAPNTPDYPAAFHGVLGAGAVASPANALYTPDELAHQLRDSAARILFTTPGHLDRARAAVAHDGVRVSEIVVLGEPTGRRGAVPETSLDEMVGGADTSRAAAAVAPDDLAALPYSSGTTGLPKGVQLTHRNLAVNLLQNDPIGRVRPHSRLIAVVPMSHSYGITAVMNQGLQYRALVVTLPRFELAAFLQAIAEHRINHIHVVPPIMLALARSPLVDSYDLSSLDIVVSAAAPLDRDLAKAVADRLGVTVLQAYGMTESSPCTHGIPRDRPDIDRGSIGVVMPNVEARVVDLMTGTDVAGGEPGELICRGPNIMRGYRNNPEATAATVDADGYLHTGDVVTVSEDGVFHVVDRVKELIKYKGYQVAPAELEALLLRHEGIADAAVVGLPGPDGEERPKAFVVRRECAEQLPPEKFAEDVMNFVADRVAPYKKVRAVEFVDLIPRSAAGKILRKALRAASRGSE